MHRDDPYGCSVDLNLRSPEFVAAKTFDNSRDSAFTQHDPPSVEPRGMPRPKLSTP